jgi:hypothetical protein
MMWRKMPPTGARVACRILSGWSGAGMFGTNMRHTCGHVQAAVRARRGGRATDGGASARHQTTFKQKLDSD